MLFNSYIFILIFLPICFIGYFYLASHYSKDFTKPWLIACSLFFYGWWNKFFIPILVISMVMNFVISRLIIDNKYNFWSKKTYLIIGLIFNIALLSYFKYADFFLENINALFGTGQPLLNLVLPLAISFYTIQQIAYLVDCYEGLANEKSFANYCLFVIFFPQLIAGPIIHHKDILPQFADQARRLKNNHNISLGIFVFSVGLFKKVVIADTFEQWATPGFDIANSLNFFEAWFTSLSFTFQIYYDFSGYCDMALGLALLFNINLPINFNNPYKSTGMIEFWKRWHITLTSFITTYIYTPLLRSFNKPTFTLAMCSTMISFLIAGLWHGASWMFILFGTLNGLGIVINHVWQKKIKLKINSLLAWVITFNYVNLTMIIFRSNDIDTVIKILNGMFGFENFTLPYFLHNYIGFLETHGVTFGSWLVNISGSAWSAIWVFSALTLIHLPTKLTNPVNHFKENFYFLVIGIFFLTAGLLSINKNSVFLYFNF